MIDGKWNTHIFSDKVLCWIISERLCIKLDKTDATILKYQHHPPIFDFQAKSVADVMEIIMQFKTDKVVSGEIPAKLLKDCEFSFHTLPNYINESTRVYERLMFDQLFNHTKNILSQTQLIKTKPG